MNELFELGNVSVNAGPPRLSLDKGDSERVHLIRDVGSGLTDDDFFHLTCHVYPSIIGKIECGEFVDLEKLLVRDKYGGGQQLEGRMEWIHRDGNTFLVPASCDIKINSVRCWEQAFRVYATIYCGANPHRAKEIWQYVSVINTTAVSYSWDNVSAYDVTFRHLMAFNPSRSWAISYTHMWNLCMKDPIVKTATFRNNYQNFNNSFNSGSNHSSANMTPQQNKSSKPRHCWNFNKGVPCKFSPKCKFIE